MNLYVPGQRWISESEPELGWARSWKPLVDAYRWNSKQRRNAHLRRRPGSFERVRFRAGEKIKTQTDQEFIVKDVVEQRGC